MEIRFGWTAKQGVVNLNFSDPRTLYLEKIVWKHSLRTSQISAWRKRMFKTRLIYSFILEDRFDEVMSNHLTSDQVKPFLLTEHSSSQYFENLSVTVEIAQF